MCLRLELNQESIPAGGPIVDEFFSTDPGWFFDMCTIQLEPKTHLPLIKIKCAIVHECN